MVAGDNRCSGSGSSRFDATPTPASNTLLYRVNDGLVDTESQHHLASSMKLLLNDDKRYYSSMVHLTNDEPSAASCHHRIRRASCNRQQCNGAGQPETDNSSLGIGQQQQQQVSASSKTSTSDLATSELLKLTNLKLHDDDDDDDEETTTRESTHATETIARLTRWRNKSRQDNNTIEAAQLLVWPTEPNHPLNIISHHKSSMLVATSTSVADQRARQASSPQSQVAITHSSSASSEPNRMEQQQQQQHQAISSQQMITDDYHSSVDYSTELHHQPDSLADFGQSVSRTSYYDTTSHNQSASGDQCFVVNGGHYAHLSEVLDVSASYGQSGYSTDDAYLASNQPALDFLELEPSSGDGESRHLHQLASSSSNPPKLYQQQHQQQSHRHQQLTNYDATSPTPNYLNLDPTSPPTTSGYAECELPDSVIRLNHQQQQQQHLAAFGNQHDVSTIQFGDHNQHQQHQHYLNYGDGCHQQQQQQQQQDSGHVSALSCVESAGSLVNLTGLDVDQAMHHQLGPHPASIMSSSASYRISISEQPEQQQHQHQQQQQLLISHEPELKVCEWEGCENTFLDMQEFVKHLEDKHVNQEPKEKNRYFCLWSNCKRNEQEFNARYKLLIHMRVHSGEKPYPCNNQNCKKSFSRLENLKIHQRSHTGEKPYKCIFDGCSKSFTNSSDRIKHHKTHKDPKPYSCSHTGCSKRYTDPSSLRKHLRAHKRIQSVAAAVSGQPATTTTTGNFYTATSGDGANYCFEPRGRLSNGYYSAAAAGESPSAAAPLQGRSNPVPFAAQDANRTVYNAPTGSRLAAVVDHNNLRHNNSFNYGHNYHHHHLQQHQQQQQQQNQYHQEQHEQLSRSWCAGTTRLGPPWLPTRRGAERPATHRCNNRQQQYMMTTMQDEAIVPQQQQQQHQLQEHQRQYQHEALMRSLPLGGFRVPYSRLSHAHATAAEWPPAAAGGSTTVAATTFGHQQQQQESFASHQCHPKV